MPKKTNPKVFQVPATLAGVTTLSDGGVTVRFKTQELTPENALALMNFVNQFGWLQFSNTELQHVPTEKLSKIADGQSRSQKLRAVLYVFYKQSGRTDITFDEFYIRQMEKIIDQVKEKLHD